MKVSENIDSLKIYIVIALAVCFILIVFLLYNYFLSDKYDRKYKEGYKDIENILDWEARLPAKKTEPKNLKIENEFEFFKRTVKMSKAPEVEVQPWEPGTIAGMLFEEKRYVIKFDNAINRSEIGRYIYYILKQKEFLKVKRLEIMKDERVPLHEDEWRAEIEFAFRRPKEQE